jgi:hypothetical protein
MDLKQVSRVNTITEGRVLNIAKMLRLITEREEAEVGTDQQGRTVYRDDEGNHYIKVGGQIVDVDFDPSATPTKNPNIPIVSYPQGESGIHVGDTVKSKLSGKTFTVTKEPYHKRGWDTDGSTIIGYAAIDFVDENGKEFYGKKENYIKVPKVEQV